MIFHTVLQRSRLGSRVAAAAWLHSIPAAWVSGIPLSSVPCYLSLNASTQCRDAHSHVPYATLQDQDLAVFKSILGDAGVHTDDVALDAHNRDWMGKYQGASRCCLKPKTTEQVSAILRHCHSRGLAVVPQGGNTGLVGGSVPLADEIVLSTSAMNTIRSFEPISGVLVAQAGCVLQSIDESIADAGFTVPLDLGAKGSCQIGGNVATNAGGLRLLRYGSLHGSVLGVEVVLADGRVLDLLSTLRKDNTGYDLKQLFIGSEGTLGVITAVALQCAPRPRAVQVAFLACRSFEHVQRVLQAAKSQLGEILSAVEFLDACSLTMVLTHIPNTVNPLPSAADAPLYMVVETSGSNAQHDAEKMDAFVQGVLEHGWVVDGTMAQDDSQAGGIWRVRECISEALKHAGAVYKYDVSLPTEDMYRCVEDTAAHLASVGVQVGAPHGVQVMGYGHVGDGNLHLNISAPGYTDAMKNALEPWVYEWTAKRRGSISAEHGIGVMKAGALGYSKSPTAIHMMQGIKQLFDPRGILNPGKVLPPLVTTSDPQHHH